MTTKPTFTQSSPIVIPTITNDKLPCAPPDLFVVFTNILPSFSLTAGDPFEADAEIHDEAGAVATSFNGLVTIRVGRIIFLGPVVITGTLTVSAVAGIVIWNALATTIDSRGTFTLIGSGTGLIEGESPEIDVGVPT